MQAFSGSVNYCLWALPLSNAFVDHSLQSSCELCSDLATEF
jgi:hypothetical protein